MGRGPCMLGLAGGLLAASANVHAKVPPAYQAVAEAHGLPMRVLYAVALVESGATLSSGRRVPWPWTLNVAGRSLYFKNRAAAYVALRTALASGTRNVDVGLMQVNWRWHAERLRDPWRALDPLHNLHAGARVLKARYLSAGDWLLAAGRYHAPGTDPIRQARATRYAAKVGRELRRLEGHGR